MIKALIKKIIKLFFEVFEERYNIHKKNFKLKDTLFYLNEIYARRSADFISNNIKDAMIFDDRKPLLEFACKKCKINFQKKDGVNLEFGVYTGKSINLIASHFDKVYGFDWFNKGLEQNWTGTWRPKFKTHKLDDLPELKKNIEIILGDIRKTLPQFKKFPIDFVHIDIDTYSLCKFILLTIKSDLRRGSILVFDEFFGYPNYDQHEFKALYEVFNPSEFKFISFSKKQAAIEIL